MKILFRVPLLVAALVFMLTGRVTAQTFKVLHNFKAASGSGTTNSEGAGPNGLLLSGNTLYGTTEAGGGPSSLGTVFAINTDGTGFTTLHNFTGGSDGSVPSGGLILSGSSLFGTAQYGGLGQITGLTPGQGTMFAIDTEGTGFTILHSFTAFPPFYPLFGTNGDGANPRAGLISSGNILYGTASQGGGSGNGAIFAVNTDGTGFTSLHNFTGGSDGANPNALILSGDTLYGTAGAAGSFGSGTVFAVNTDGSGFATLHSFSGGSDGANPNGLILSGDTLYGTAGAVGSFGSGTVFAVNTDGSGFTILHNFTASPGSGSFGPLTNSDGASPSGRLILSGSALYGTAVNGGDSGNGTVFKVNTDGTGFATLYSFTAVSVGTNSDGSNPSAGLILSGTTVYGAAKQGGSSGNGTLFKLFIAPQLAIVPSGAHVILSWPTDATGFTLQFTTNLGSSGVWSAVSPAPIVLNGQNTVTNPISTTQQFYRLAQ